MSNEQQHEVSLEAASALATYLRRNPEAASRTPEELAERFGLPVSFVYNVLDSLRPPTKDEAEPLKITLSLEPLRRAWDWMVSRFDRLTANPMRYIAWSLVLSVAVLFTLAAIATRSNPGETNLRLLTGSAGAVVGAVTLALHLACYFRRAMVRFAVLGGLLVWVALSIALMVITYVTPVPPNLTPAEIRRLEAGRDQAILLIPIGVAILAAVYAGAGSLMAILGGYVRIRQTERRRDQMTRQERLERYLQLKSRLAQSADLGSEQTWVDRLPYIEFARQQPFLVVGLVAVLISVAAYLVEAWLPSSPVQRIGGVQVLGLAIWTIIFVIQALLYVGIGFLARRYWRAILVALFVTILQTLVIFVPPITGITRPNLWPTVAISTAFYLTLTLISAWGAHVQRVNTRQRMLVRNDRATLMAEMIQLQWELSVEDVTVCVLVVDAARSSEMKSTADPFVVEYSFRRYQEWLAQTAARYGGRVHSTAGDGAVVAFDTPQQAFDAARKIQSDLDRFNREENRLNKPFRLRIGLHLGKVTADLDQVQFSEVIDIAAHVQQVSPIGGIALTQAVADQVTGEEFVSLTKEVDAQPVLIALNPTA